MLRRCSQRTVRGIPVEVSTVVNPGPAGSSHWIIDWSVCIRNATLRLPRSSMPNFPQV